MSDMQDIFDDLNREISRKLNPLTDPLIKISAASKLNQYPNTTLSTNLFGSTAVAALIKQYEAKKNVSSLFNWNDSLFKLASSHQPKNSASQLLSSILGGSMISNLSMVYSNKVNSAIPSSAVELIMSNQRMFNKQISIYETVFKQFYETEKLKYPSWLEEFNLQKEYNKATTLSSFEILTAASLIGIKKDEEHEFQIEKPDEELDKVSKLLEENNELKAELHRLLSVITTISQKKKKKSLKKQYKELQEPLKQFTYFLHLKLLGNSQTWSLQSTYTVLHIINTIIIQALVLSVIFGKTFENLMFDDEPKNEMTIKNQFVSNDNRQTIIYNLISTPDAWAIVTESTNAYRRKSYKTDCVGKISENTSVRILQRKGEWIFVESAMIKVDKKSKNEIDIVTRGWIKLKNIRLEDE